MRVMVDRITPQPLVGAVTLTGGLAALGGTWVLQASSSSWNSQGTGQAILSLVLVVAVVLARQLPMHVRSGVKVYIATVPLYLMVALLTPALAATAVALAVLAGELATRRRTGNPPADMANQTGRWGGIAIAASAVAHVNVPAEYNVLPLVGAAAILWAGDILTSPLSLIPVIGGRADDVMVLVAKQAGKVEGAQYLVALLGAMVGRQDVWTLILLALPTMLVYYAFKDNMVLRNSTLEMLEKMADTVDLRDPYTFEHSRRVADYCYDIAKQMGWPEQMAERTVAAARLHDIGKIRIPDEILKKDSGLTLDQQAEMNLHPEYGADFLAKHPDFVQGIEIVRHHHESWDGTGYPHRLKGNEIPVGSRIIAVADSFDAMTTDRPYRRAMSWDRAAQILREGRGIQWDGKVVDAFLASISDKLSQQPHLRIVSDDEDTTGSAAG